MEIKHKYGEYLAPEVKVIEIESRGVLCTSTTDMPVDETYNF